MPIIIEHDSEHGGFWEWWRRLFAKLWGGS